MTYRPQHYEIRVEGQLPENWSDWFGKLTVLPTADGNSLLTGPIRDQSELHGMLIKIRDLGLVLISVHRLD